jgi:predicted amidophosphoribosyltransferase
MAVIPHINHSRCQLHSHLNAYEEGAYSLFVSRDVYPELFDLQHADIRRKTSKPWKASPNGKMRYLWFPGLDEDEVAAIDDWRGRFEKYVLLGLNSHIEDHFTNELDFCMALDFNYDRAAEKRTIYGEAEYQLKYQGSRQHFQVLVHALVEAVADLPIPPARRDNYCISCVPGSPDTASVQYRLATAVAEKVGVDFIDADLHSPKAALKGLTVEQKIPTWQKLYDDGCVNLSGDVQGRLVVVVDDLYQSGATLWMYAKYLKEQGATHVLGLPCVKSLRDSDNR